MSINTITIFSIFYFTHTIQNNSHFPPIRALTIFHLTSAKYTGTGHIAQFFQIYFDYLSINRSYRQCIIAILSVIVVYSPLCGSFYIFVISFYYEHQELGKTEEFCGWFYVCCCKCHAILYEVGLLSLQHKVTSHIYY